MSDAPEPTASTAHGEGAEKRTKGISSYVVMLLVTLGAAGVLLGLVALVLAVAAWMRLARLRREFAAVRPQLGPERSPDSVDPRGAAFDPNAIRDVAVVRYDALQEMGGRLSFSLALLDAVGDGVVLSSINGRTETRTYAKVIRGGEPTHPLSPEEERAVNEARVAREGTVGTARSFRRSAVSPSTRPVTDP